jgi:hypothetical protein
MLNLILRDRIPHVKILPQPAKLGPVAFVDFCAISNAKIPIIQPALAVFKVKNRLTGDFLGFYTRSATNC